MKHRVPVAVGDALDRVCEGATEVAGCLPGYAIEHEREYVRTVRAAFGEALGYLPPLVLESLARKLEAAFDVCDAHVLLGESRDRLQHTSIEASARPRAARPTRVPRPRPFRRTRNGQRVEVILRALAEGHTDRAALVRYVAEAMGEGDLSVSRNRTGSVLWTLASRGVLTYDRKAVRRLPEPS